VPGRITVPNVAVGDATIEWHLYSVVRRSMLIDEPSGGCDLISKPLQGALSYPIISSEPLRVNIGKDRSMLAKKLPNSRATAHEIVKEINFVH
jgi:hypothetical protein